MLAKPLRVLVVDGDGAALRRLCHVLSLLNPSGRVEEAVTASQAAGKIAEMAPELVLLDLDLADVSGIEALRGPDAPGLIVTTAHPEVAMRSFDLDAVDCLVKPVERARVATALDRAQRRLAERRIAVLALEIAGAAALIRGGPALAAAGRYPDQMTIRVRRRMFALGVGDIAWIEGASQYSRVHAASGEYLLSRSLSSLEAELDPARFFRIHRSAIVNAACVSEVMSRGDGRYDVYLRSGEALPLGRGRREVLARLLAALRGGKKSGGLSAAASG